MDQTINFNEQNKKKKQTNEKTKRKKKKRHPEGLYFPGSGMLVFSRTLLDS